MALCNHLDGVKTCQHDPKPLPGEAAIMVISSVADERAWPRLRRVHDAANGRFVLIQENPVNGVRALYELRHDSSATQTGTDAVIDGEPVRWNGGSLAFVIRHAGGDTQIVLEQPEGC